MPLFLIATPLGHLLDISERALASLRSSDLVLCEDTRTSRVLLQHYEIDKPLASFHKFNEEQMKSNLLDQLACGRQIALISDAGTPCLCDPGQELVASCRANGYEVTPIPGACSVIAALTASGLPCSPFQFIGFLDKSPGAKRKSLKNCLQYPGTSVFFESPHRVLVTLQILSELDPSRRIALAKEITKKFEAFFLGTSSELLEELQKRFNGELRGEWVVMIEPNLQPLIPPALQEACEKVLALESKGLSRRDSLHAVCLCLGVSSQDLYQALEQFKEK